ncbi:MAG: DUF4173 domain-containing protein [Aggregatilineales bacterium]
MQIDHPENLIGINGDYPGLEFDDIADAQNDEEARQRVAEENAHKQHISIHVLVASLLMGVVGNLLFHSAPLGINLPLFVLAFMLMAFGLLRLLNVTAYPANLSLLIPALMFSVWMSVIASPTLMLLNASVAFCTLALSLRFSGIPRFLGGSLRCLFENTMDMFFVAWLRDPLNTIMQSVGYLKNNGDQFEGLKRFRALHLASIVRGALLTLPVVIVFGVLLGSADAIFAGIMDDALAWINPKSPWNTFGQLMTIGTFAWFSMAGFRLMLTAPLNTSAEAKREKRKPLLRLSMIEAGMMLGAVNALFIVFMLIQARYLFGGEANINTQGLTYAQYARRGFQELLTVSCMTVVLTLMLDNLTVRDRDHDRLFRGLVTAMIGLTALLLVAAFYRLYLYQDAYGYTRIRVMSGAFMLWLAVLFGFLLWDIWRVGEARSGRVFWIGCIVALFGFAFTLNAINMDRFIASRNIARWEHGESLDVGYLTELSDDALPVIAPLLDNANLTTAQSETLLTQLGYRLYTLDNWHEDRGLFGYHLGLERAWSALNAHRDALSAYIVPRPSRYGYSGGWD